MVKIIYKQQDLLDAEEYFIAHGCNAQGVMGAGIALKIKQKFPIAYTKYLELVRDGLNSNDLLGKLVSVYDENRNKIIINMITQEYYGREIGKRYCSYDAIANCISTINKIEKIKTKRVAMPKIGSKLGGGDWNVISTIIESEATNFQPVVYYL